jgi:hypothetical protein
VISYNSGTPASNPANPLTNNNNNNAFLQLHEKAIYKFDNPSLAFQILSEFDSFEPLPAWVLETLTMGKKFLGIIRDDTYCERSRKWFTEHGDVLFTKKNIMTDHAYISIARGAVISKIATDVHPEIVRGLKQRIPENADVFALKPEIHLYFMNGGMHRMYFLNKQFNCNHQAYSHIHGATELNRKSNLAINYQQYIWQYQDRPGCVEEFMPESYILKNATQCLMFFDYINTDYYKEEKRNQTYVFFKKLGRGSHRGEGVFLFDDVEEEMLRAELQNGKGCSGNIRDLQMQRYLPNPMLLHSHKFDFRVYMLIVSTNPLIMYYHDGFAKLSLHLYTRNSTAIGAHLSNTEVSKEIFDQARNGGYLGMNETEIRSFQTWLYYRLQAYLLETGRTTDPNWVVNNMIPQMKKAMIHVGRMSHHGMLKRSSLWELFGVDFILDEDLKIWFIEANTSPMMEATTPEREKLLVGMLTDQFEVMFAYLRSRMKRVITFINGITKSLPSEYVFYDAVMIPDYAKRKLEYDELNKNKLDPEFELSENNGFSLIIDENEEGPGRYAGFIPEECY